MKKTVRLLLTFFTAAFLPATRCPRRPGSFLHQAVDLQSRPQSRAQAEIPAFDRKTNTLWMAGIVGVDVLDAETGALVSTSTPPLRLDQQRRHSRWPGCVRDRGDHPDLSRRRRVLRHRDALAGEGVNVVPVGALPDMLTFTPDGRKLAASRTRARPPRYGARIGAHRRRTFSARAGRPAGSVTIIDVKTRTVDRHGRLRGRSGLGSQRAHGYRHGFRAGIHRREQRRHTGLRHPAGRQRHRRAGPEDRPLHQDRRPRRQGLQPARQPDRPEQRRHDSFISPNVKGLYMPDSIAAYESRGKTYLVMANEGDFREDDGDRSAASTPRRRRRRSPTCVSPTPTPRRAISSPPARARSRFATTDGTLVYDSGDILDKKAAERGIYDDGRSRDKGVEPEGVALLEIGGRTYAFVGLERTLKGAVAVFDIDGPAKPTFIDMIVTEGDLAPEGLAAYHYRGDYFLAIANEVSNTTTLYRIDRNRHGEISRTVPTTTARAASTNVSSNELAHALPHRNQGQLLRSTPNVADSRLNIGDHRFDQPGFGVHRCEVQRGLPAVADGAPDGGQQQQQRPAGQRLSSCLRVGCAHVPAPPVVDQRHRARRDLAAMHVARGEAAPAPLVLQLVEAILASPRSR